jgi:hypothetical protein
VTAKQEANQQRIDEDEGTYEIIPEPAAAIAIRPTTKTNVDTIYNDGKRSYRHH